MVEHPPPPKAEEQHPLLKVETGGGDSGRAATLPVAAPGYNVTCSTKRSWYDRWPGKLNTKHAHQFCTEDVTLNRLLRRQ